MSVTPETALSMGPSGPSEPTIGLAAELAESRTSVPLVSSEPPISPQNIPTPVPEVSLWDQICKEFAAQRPPFRDPDEEPPRTPTPPPLPPKDTCSPSEYLEHYIFPILLPAMEKMLKQAKVERCFERKRTKFNACDFLTEYLYTNNPEYKEREGMPFEEIPFVQEHWKTHPRPPLPMSVLWSEQEAIQLIQNFWRGYQVRKDPEIHELRQWQQEWREESGNIKHIVSDFWANQMPDEQIETPRENEEPQVESENVDRVSSGKQQTPDLQIVSSDEVPTAVEDLLNKDMLNKDVPMQVVHTSEDDNF